MIPVVLPVVSDTSIPVVLPVMSDTSMPVVLLGVFDWDINPELDGDEFKNYLPKIYYPGQHR